VVGNSTAWLADSVVTAGTAGVTLLAHDTSSFGAAALSAALDYTRFPGLELVDVALTRSAATNFIDKSVSAAIDRSDVTSVGDVRVEAVNAVEIAASAKANTVTASPVVLENFSLAAGGTYVVNMLLGTVTASIADSTVTTTGVDATTGE